MENRILHVEDNPDDVMLMNLAFNRAGITARLHVVNDGDEAIAALEDSAVTGGAPVCVLLDVKLPRVSSFY
jgi:CheY-like chemotaxis protein